MPRFTRSAYITGSADGVASSFGTGPRSLGGTLSAAITLRTPAGDMSDPIDIGAGWSSGHARIEVPASMEVSTLTLPSGRVEIVIRQRGA